MPDVLTEITYEEMQGSPKETLSLNGFTATRVIKTPWATRAQIQRDLLRTTFPGAEDNIICTSTSSVPLLGRNLGVDHIAAYDFAIITLQYEPITAPIVGAGDRVITTETIEPTSEFLTVGVNNLRWEEKEGDQVTEEQAPGQLHVGFDYVITQEGLKEFPTNLLDLVGKVNDVAVSPISEGLDVLVFPPETLLYNPPSISPGFDSDGNRIWNVTYRLTFKPNFEEVDGVETARGWNFFWRSDAIEASDSFSGTFQKMVDAVSGKSYKVYRAGDFTTLTELIPII